MTTDIAAIGLPFEEAIAFFRQKTRMPSRRWSDVYAEAHSRGFMVAGAGSDALLADFQKEIRKALEQGTTLATFRKGFDTIVDRHGWAYNGTPGWRSRIIYETNLSTAYSAGRYAQLSDPDVLEQYPYWTYIHSGSRHPRLQHLAWNGLTLRADDPFWHTHYPPNGWRCGCRVAATSGADLRRMGKRGPDTAPPIETRPWRNPSTGKIHQVPVGIDPGFEYNPGEAWKKHQAQPVRPPGPASAGDAPPLRGAPGGVVDAKPPIETRPWRNPSTGKNQHVPVGIDPGFEYKPGEEGKRHQAKPVRPPGAASAGDAPPLRGATGGAVDADTLRAFVKEPKGRIQVGSLNPPVMKALGTHSAAVLLSDETMAKQTEHHPDLSIDDYLRIGDMLAHPDLVLRYQDRRIHIVHRGDVTLLGVVKATAQGAENYLVSLRKARPKDLRRVLRQGKIVYEK